MPEFKGTVRALDLREEELSKYPKLGGLAADKNGMMPFKSSSDRKSRVVAGNSIKFCGD